MIGKKRLRNFVKIWKNLKKFGKFKIVWEYGAMGVMVCGVIRKKWKE